MSTPSIRWNRSAKKKETHEKHAVDNAEADTYRKRESVPLYLMNFDYGKLTEKREYSTKKKGTNSERQSMCSNQKL